jgi:hypothetical protein
MREEEEHAPVFLSKSHSCFSYQAAGVEVSESLTVLSQISGLGAKREPLVPARLR